MTVIIAITMSPNKASPARRATEAESERDRTAELDDAAEDGEEAARLETGDVLHEARGLRGGPGR